MNPLVKVIDKTTTTELFSCPMEEIEQAYHFAQKMEEMGLEVYVESPSITKTLALSLGISDQRLQTYEKSVAQEIDDHDCGSCATTNLKTHSKE
jgi:hypothetical protein